MFKRIFIWFTGIIVVSLLLMQFYHIAYLFKRHKQQFFQQFPYTFNPTILFKTPAHTKLTFLVWGVFTAIVFFQSGRILIKKMGNRYTEEGDKINYTNLSSKHERKRGLLRVEFNRKGEITTKTLRWALDVIFNPVKTFYNNILSYFKVNPKYYLNTYKENKQTFNPGTQYHAGGLPLIAERKFSLFGKYIRLYLAIGDIHNLFIGSTGRGKSVTFVIVMLYFYCLAGENVFATDPKGELYNATQSLFKEHRYNVIVMDYTDPKNSQRWNPLQLPLQIYEKEITTHFFSIKLEGVGIDDVLSEYFLLEDNTTFDFLGETVTLQLKEEGSLQCSIHSEFFEELEIGLYVIKVKHWSKHCVIQEEPALITKAVVSNKEVVFESVPEFIDGTHNVSSAIEMLRDISNAIAFDSATRDPFWSSGAADMITGGALLLLENGAKEKLNFKSIRALYDNEQVLKEFLERTTDIESYSRKYISTYVNAIGPTKASLKSVFLNKLSLLDANDDIARITSNESTFDLTNVGFEKTIIYLIIHDEKKTYHPLVTMFVKQLYEVLVSELRKRQLDRLPAPFNLTLDEFGVTPPVKDVDSMYAASRSRGIRINAFIQTFEQLQQIYGDKLAKVIEDNCSNVIYLNSKTDSAAEYFEKAAGKKIISTKDGYKVVNVISKERLKQFPKGKSLITTIERKPYISNLPPVFKYPFYRKPIHHRNEYNHPEVQIYDLAYQLKQLKKNKQSK